MDSMWALHNLKEKSDKKSWDSFNFFFMTGYVYTQTQVII